jgi:hypothetical protein
MDHEGAARQGEANLLVKAVFGCEFAAPLLWLSSAVVAQTGQGIISGMVSDPSGSSIPHAEVAARNTDTNVVINTTTNTTASYEIRDLNPRNYGVSVTAAESKHLCAWPACG